jgi:ATP-binding cassette subfamily C protein CydD
MSAVTATTTDLADGRRRERVESEAAGWLTDAAAVGTRQFRVSAALVVVQTIFTVLQWAGVAIVAQGVMLHQAEKSVLGLVVLVGGAALAALSGWAARSAAADGRIAVATGVRRAVLDSVLPQKVRTSDTEAAASAHALVDLADDVADYHSTVVPLRLAAPVSMMLILGATLIVHWPAAILLVLSTALVPINMKLAGLFAQDGNDRYLAATQRLSAVILDSFRGLHTLKNLRSVGRRGREIDLASRALNTANMTVLKRAFLSGLIMDVVVTFSIASNATYIGLALLRYVTVPGVAQISLFSGLFVLLLCPMYFMPLRTVAAAFHDRERAEAAARAILALGVSRPSAVAARARSAASAAALANSALADVVLAGSVAPVTAAAGSVSAASRGTDAPIAVRLDRLRYQPPGSDVDLLDIPALSATAGVWTAVTGVSGAGKTTLLALIAGLRMPSSGAISWQRSPAHSGPPVVGGAAWIGQRTVIIEDTIAENVRLGRGDASASEIAAAIRAAGLDSVVGRLADGAETVIGDNGWGLSTGEARRVSIARAILSGARLWIMDEPTAHLDPETEAEVLDAVELAASGCTVIVATHSPEVVRRAAQVWIVDDGSVTVDEREIAA